MPKSLFVFTLIIYLLIGSISFADLNSPDIDREKLHRNRVIKPIAKTAFSMSTAMTLPKPVDFSDLKISETVSPATFTQKNSQTAELSDGSFVIVWQDKRLGNYQIYGQVYDSNGVTLGTNTLLAGRNDGYDLIEPKAVSNGIGGFYLAWRDVALGKIYVSGFDASLNETLSPRIVNDIPSGSYSGPFDIDSYGDFRFAIAWEDYGVANDIMLRIYSSDGTALIDPVRINTDAGPASHWVPSVVFGNVGSLAVAWEDYRNGNADIFFQLVYADGSLNGTNISLVEALYDDSAQYLPEIAYSPRDGYAVGWLDKREGSSRVYVQRYDISGGLTGGNVKISNSDPQFSDWDIDMTVNSADNLNMIWASIDSVDQIVFQKFTTDFAPSGSSAVVNNFVTDSRWECTIQTGISDKLICTWSDFRSGNGDIHFQYLTPDGSSLIGGDKLANDDSEGAEATEPDIVTVDDTKCAVVFADTRNDAGDIFLQLVSNDGTAIGSNIKLNSDVSGILQNEPAVAVSDTAVLTVWNDSRSVMAVSGQRIFGRYLDYDGIFKGNDFVICDSAAVTSKSSPAVAITSNNKALVVWIDFGSGLPEVLGRLFGPDGLPAGSVLTLSTDADDIGNDDVYIVADNSDIFTVAWLARDASGGPKAIIARYTNDGSLLNRFSYTSTASGIDITDISIAVDNSGWIYMVWEGSGSNLYFNRFETNGAVDIDASHFDSGSSAPFEPDITADLDGNVIISQIKTTTGVRRVYYQILNSSLNAFTQGYISLAATSYMVSPSVTGGDRTAGLVWSDPRAGGISIYGSLLSYIPTSIGDDNHELIPSDFSLMQNYPNPFNPSTRIEFTVPAKSNVNLSIYNILGERIITLVNHMYETGNYSVFWDGTDSDGCPVASGIYLYKMKTERFETTRKMFLIK